MAFLARPALDGTRVRLEPDTHRPFEARFGRDLSAVGIHTDDAVAQTTDPLEARASTPVRLTRTDVPMLARQVKGGSGSPPTSEDVWGFKVTKTMCACVPNVIGLRDWAQEAEKTYKSCDQTSFTTGGQVEACFHAIHPTATVEAETSESGAVALPPPSKDPCERIDQHGTSIHETFHIRYGDSLAKSLGKAFLVEWTKLRGDPDRLTKLKAKFPKEVAAFDSHWNSASEWAKDEQNSYRWERRFYADVLAALKRICQ
jgi:hypothetical protein